MDRAALVAALRQDEGLRLRPYDDADGHPLTQHSVIKGHPTIGVGRCLDLNGISEAEALYLLDNDIDNVVRHLDTTLPWWQALSDERQLAIANMCFNLGIGNLLGFHDFLAHLKESNWEAAAAAMEDSVWFHKAGARGERLMAAVRGTENV